MDIEYKFEVGDFITSIAFIHKQYSKNPKYRGVYLILGRSRGFYKFKVIYDPAWNNGPNEKIREYAKIDMEEYSSLATEKQIKMAKLLTIK